MASPQNQNHIVVIYEGFGWSGGEDEKMRERERDLDLMDLVLLIGQLMEAVQLWGGGAEGGVGG